MSFISGMVTSLKNNKRDRKNAFEILKENGEYARKTELHFENSATKSQLLRIREKLKADHKKAIIRKVIIIGILLAVAIYCIGFAKF
jgi:hypothetical protein